MNKNEGGTMISQRECDCSSEKNWEEVGSTWLCTCPDNGRREKKEAPTSEMTERTFQAYSDH